MEVLNASILASYKIRTSAKKNHYTQTRLLHPPH